MKTVSLSKITPNIPHKLQFVMSFMMLMWQTKGSLPQGVSLVSFLQYAVPGLLYSVSNNLSMMMQVYMDPTTFQVRCRSITVSILA